MSGAASLETRMDDVRAVMDAVDSQRAVIVGFSEGCAMSALFAATYPDRVSQLVLIGGFKRSADRIEQEALDERIAQILKLWGSGAMIKTIVTSLSPNPRATDQFGKFERLSASVSFSIVTSIPMQLTEMSDRRSLRYTILNGDRMLHSVLAQ